jgi:hypothetical protein
MRRAFIGLSGPLGYDYKNQFEKIHLEEASSPNPILENAMGILLFYDELIFACPQVCPKSMRQLDYVKFLSELPNYEEKIKKINEKIKDLDIDSYRDLSEKIHGNKNYAKAIKKILGDSVSFTALNTSPRFLIDHHTHGFYLGGDEWTRASSFDIKGWLFDTEVMREFDLMKYDPIFNSNTLLIAEDFENKYKESYKLSDELLIRNIPNYINESGPYNESIEELRHHKFIVEFRTHLDDIMANSNTKELEEIAKSVEFAADEIRRKVFLKHMKNYNSYWGLVKSTGTEIVGLVVPGIGLATELGERYFRDKENKGFKWAAFLTELEIISQKE